MMVFVGGNPENGLFFKVVKKKIHKTNLQNLFTSHWQYSIVNTTKTLNRLKVSFSDDRDVKK